MNATTLLSDLEYTDSGVVWDMYTAAGWFAALLGFLNIFLFLPCIYQEYPIAAREAQLQKRLTSGGNGDNLDVPKPDYLMLIVVLLSFFIILTIYVLLETLMVPMTMDLYAWTDEMAITVIGIGLSIAGVVTVVMFGSVGLMSKKVDERKIFIFLGLVPLLVATFCFFPMGSTYPKMQNCTVNIESYEMHSTDPTRFDPDKSEVIASTTIPSSKLLNDENIVEFFTGDAVTVTDSVDAVTYSTNIPFNENENFIDSPLPVNLSSYSNLTTLSRRRRHAVRDGKCLDLGCPPEQSWCYYTPIIEKPQLGVACLIAVIGYPIAFALCSSFFSKLLGPKPQGVWMGILTSTGSFSRVVGPIFVSYMYTELGTRWTFGILFFVLLFNIVFVSFSYKRLVPLKVTT